MTSKDPTSTIRVPFNDRLQKLVATAWDEIEADAYNVPRPIDRPLAHFSLNDMQNCWLAGRKMFPARS